MITIFLGNVGSGKTLSAIEFMLSHTDRPIYTNIAVKKCKQLKHVVKLKPEMIVKKEITVGKMGKEHVTLSFNKDYWVTVMQKHPSIHVILDEAHTLLNPRRAMSKVNIIMTDFLALLRRIVGQDASGHKGNLILITQLNRRLDVIAKEMSTCVKYHVFNSIQACPDGHCTKHLNNESMHDEHVCPHCQKKLQKVKEWVEMYEFRSTDDFQKEMEYGIKTHVRKHYMLQPEKLYKLYNTLQWDDLLAQY